MEAHQSHLNRSGSTLESDTRHRLLTRLIPAPGPNQKAFQSLGNSLAPVKKGGSTVPSSSQRGQTSCQNEARATETAKFKPVVKTSATSTVRPKFKTAVKTRIIKSSDDEDELDFLSQSSTNDPSSRSSPVRPRGKEDWDTIVDGSKGRGGDSLASQAEARTKTLRNLKFTKNRTKAVAPPTVLEIDDIDDDSFAATPKPRASQARGEDERPGVAPLTLTQVNMRSRRSPPPRAMSPKPPRQRYNDNNMLLKRPKRGRADEVKKSSAPAYRASSDSRVSRLATSILDVDRASSSKVAPRRVDDFSPEREERKKKKVPEAFPMPSPASSPQQVTVIKRTASVFPHPSPLASGKTPRSPTRKPVRVPAAFPTLSPRKDDLSDGGTAVSKVRNDKGKGRALDKENDEDEYVGDKKKLKSGTNRQKKLEEFPMNTHMLKSLDSTSPPRPRKRVSEDGSGDDHTPKKIKKSPSQYAFEDEGDSICIAPDVDPKTLCPYCDTPLPTSPSPLLLKILAETKKKARRDPRPSNPLGLRAPLTVFIGACQRHRFESQILPEAERKGWPKTIDWKGVSGRILKMRSFLKALIEDPGSDATVDNDLVDEWDIKYTGSQKRETKVQGAKARSVFWTELLEEVKLKGLRAVSGVRGQFANFEKAQPGYYGEIGSVIIHQTLYNMFPLAEMNPALVAPLTTNEFVQRILVPEVALHLIMEDKHMDSNEDVKAAVAILRDSSAYGVAMFPEDGGEWDTRRNKHQEEKIGVGDMIVLERARKRRKELEEEDVREEAERQAMEEARRVKLSSKVKARAAVDEDMLASSDVGGPDQPQQPPRPRPRPRPKVEGTNIDIVGGRVFTAQGAEDNGKDSRTSRSRSQSVASSIQHGPEEKTKDMPTRSWSQGSILSLEDNDLGSDSDIYASDRPRASSIERRRSPSASETRNPQYASDKEPSSTLTRRGVSMLTIDSDSDISTTAPAAKGKRAPSCASSRTGSVAKTAVGKRRSAIQDEESDDDVVEIVETSSSFVPVTPMLRRSAPTPKSFPMDVDRDEDNHDTPKPLPSKRAPIPPLEKARRRKLTTQSTYAGSQASAARTKTAASRGTSTSKSTRSDRGASDEPIVLPNDSDPSCKPGKPNKEDSDWLLSGESDDETKQAA